MARPTEISREKLTTLLQMRGPVSASELASLLKVSPSTVLRALKDFDGRLVVFGATRSRRYALRRTIRNIGDRWLVYRIDETGRAESWASLEAMHERRWRILWTGSPPAWASHFADRDGFWEGYPFFLSDIRPQGFLGRILAGRISRSLDLPPNPRTWSDDLTQVFLNSEGSDLPGSLVVGDHCLLPALEQVVFPENAAPIAEEEISTRYPDLADGVMETLPGSSAGGEQPKFLTSLKSADASVRPVLVKFSPPMGQLAGQRWADLLRCEYHAQQILASEGLALSGARTLDAAGRRFLEVPRFDRLPGGGRRGVVSLEALHHAAIGSGQGEWPSMVMELQDWGLTDPAALHTCRRLHAFGGLIGNTDMHPGNLAFWLDDTLPFRLAPSYDMLPMLLAPGPQGEMVDRPFIPAIPLPANQEAWQEAAGWAAKFWQAVVEDARISPEFRRAATGFQETVGKLRAHWG